MFFQLGSIVIQVTKVLLLRALAMWDGPTRGTSRGHPRHMVCHPRGRGRPGPSWLCVLCASKLR